MSKYIVARGNGREVELGQVDDDCEVIDIIGTPSISDDDELRVNQLCGENATYHVIEK